MRPPTMLVLILLGVAPSIADTAASAGTSMVSNPRAERLPNSSYAFAKPKTEIRPGAISRPLLCRIIRCIGDRSERR